MRRVMIQAGHRSPRQPGFEAGTGAAGEAEYVAQVADSLSARLRADGRFEVANVPGWIRPDGWTGDLFLALHCDGSANPAASGYSYGYPPAELGPLTRRFLAVHRDEYESLPGHPPHGRDNYTADLAGYYGFHHVHAPIKVLHEHGFVSNPHERAWLESNRPAIVGAHYRAICRTFQLVPKGSGGGGVPPDTRQVGGEGDYVVLLSGILPPRTVVDRVKVGEGRVGAWLDDLRLLAMLEKHGNALVMRKVYRSEAPAIGKRL